MTDMPTLKAIETLLRSAAQNAGRRLTLGRAAALTHNHQETPEARQKAADVTRVAIKAMAAGLDIVGMAAEVAATPAGEQIADLEAKIDHWEKYSQHREEQDQTLAAGVNSLAFFGESVPHGVYASGDVAVVTDVGTERKANQDSVACFKLADGREVFVVADGMGGHAGGEIASRLVIKHFQAALETGADLREAVLFANLGAGLDREAKVKSGSTLVAAILDRQNKKLQVAHVGDSRAKFVTAGGATHLTVDHSAIFEEIARKETRLIAPPLTDADVNALENHYIYQILQAQASVISVALGTHNMTNSGLNHPGQIRITTVDLIPANQPSTLLLYSDGAIDKVREDELTAIAQQKNSAEEIAVGINDNACNRSQDNISVIAVRLPFALDLSTVTTVNYGRADHPPLMPLEERRTFIQKLAALQVGERGFIHWLMQRLTNFTGDRAELVTKLGALIHTFTGLEGKEQNTVSQVIEKLAALPTDLKARFLANTLAGLSLSPEQHGLLNQRLAQANLTFAQISGFGLHEQLAALSAPLLQPAVRAKLLDNLVEKHFNEVKKYLKVTGDIRTGAEMVLECWLRRCLVNTVGNAKNGIEGMTLMIDNFDRNFYRQSAQAILLQIAANGTETPAVRTAADLVAKKINFSWGKWT